MKIPSSMLNHPSVEIIEHGPPIGFEDYKYFVVLKDGHAFRYGKAAGCSSCTFNSVQDFKDCRPELVSKP